MNTFEYETLTVVTFAFVAITFVIVAIWRRFRRIETRFRNMSKEIDQLHILCSRHFIMALNANSEAAVPKIDPAPVASDGGEVVQLIKQSPSTALAK